MMSFFPDSAYARNNHYISLTPILILFSHLRIFTVSVRPSSALYMSQIKIYNDLGEYRIRFCEDGKVGI